MRAISTFFIAVLGILGVLAITALITGFFVTLCWNYLFVGDASILGTSLVEIGWWQGFVLAFFGGCVFKGSSSSSSSD